MSLDFIFYLRIHKVNSCYTTSSNTSNGRAVSIVLSFSPFFNYTHIILIFLISRKFCSLPLNIRKSTCFRAL